MSDPRRATTCAVCGIALSQERGTEGLCLRCLMELALESPSLMAEIDSPEEAATLDLASDQTLAEGQILGNRYRIRSLLGRGGMGKVWRAVDLKLRVDVALKALRAELLSEERALESLRQEVRVAREVISANVCRVFDLIEIDGQELVSMEFIDGITLLEIMESRAPLELSEAREIAIQFLAGLEAIHEAGLVHRDVKPENLMMTRAGRVVLMDFGIAKALAAGRSGTVAGTPAYMAPEQSRGEAPDARADVYSAGVVLAEMIAPSGLDSFEARQAIWQGIHSEPPRVPESPWAPVIRKAVARMPEQRYSGAAALARALEQVTLRVDRAEDVQPYPGLASFEEQDAEYFFGRELEIEEMWKKLRRPQIYGLIGPSGAGKSSFLRAGLLPLTPTGWRAVVMVPGSQPFANLARALVAEVSGDTEALRLLVDADNLESILKVVGGWRQQHDQVLLILDQFEELFTQSPTEIQERFSELLSRLVLETDAHLLLSMRDDFLFYCSRQTALSPIFSELTPLRAPLGAALRRALVQPALKCGYRFEDESLVDEMVEEVEQERGALPLLAFAAARLWQRRDREEGLLTRAAYEAIGGVAGALAQHAERTLEEIGQENIPIVQELFRNLVTAQGTRAARTREELLSVFEGSESGKLTSGSTPGGRADQPESERASRRQFRQDRAVAAEILDALIDARLLTSYEIAGEEEESSRQRVEIIHESLLSNWPRLVRWQAQDQEGALLRDQLRQTARMWEEKGQPEDLLWTGTSYNEYQLWRERYSGGLSTAEESFARAMTSHAERRKRRRRAAVASAFAVLLVVLAVVFASRQEARQQALRAEANQLLALGRLEIEDHPTAALAYALASLERADDPVTRLFALEILGRGPTVFYLEPPEYGFDQGAVSVDLSPDGKWLAAGYDDGNLRLWPSSGGAPRSLEKQDSSIRSVRFGPDSDLLVSRSHPSHEVTIWSVPDGRMVRRLPTQGPVDVRLAADAARLFTFTRHGSDTRVESWPLGDGGPELHADLDTPLYEWGRWMSPWGIDVDSRGTWLAYRPLDLDEPVRSSAPEIRLVSLDRSASAPAKRIETHSEAIRGLTFHPDGRHLASTHNADIRIWDLDSGLDAPERVLSYTGRGFRPRFDSAGSKLAFVGLHAAVWDLQYPPEAQPLLLRFGLSDVTNDAAFDPHGGWLATGNGWGVGISPIERRYPLVLKGHEGEVRRLAFLPDGRSLVSLAGGTLRLWPLPSTEAGGSRVVFDGREAGIFMGELRVDPSGSRILTSNSRDGSVWLVPLDGSSPRRLGGFDSPVQALALGERTAVAHPAPTDRQSLIRVWDLETGEARDLDLEEGTSIDGMMRLVPGGRLVTDGSDGTRVWNLQDGTAQIISERPSVCAVSRNGRLLLVGGQGDNGEAVLYDLEQGTSRQLDAHGPAGWVALDPGGTIAVTTGDGQVRIGPTTGEAPHVLVIPGDFRAPRISPDLRWITGGDTSENITLWPVPDLSQPPLHTLPYAELLAKLRSLTNLRIVADSESSTGWEMDIDPFPGWEELPTW